MLKLSLSFSDFLNKLIKKDKGKTNAALPTSTRANNTELTLTDVTGLHKIKMHKIQQFFIRFQQSFIDIRTQDKPITNKTPFFNVQCIHTNIKEEKCLSNK
jgi:predicted CopG family antitoxin